MIRLSLASSVRYGVHLGGVHAAIDTPRETNPVMHTSNPTQSCWRVTAWTLAAMAAALALVYLLGGFDAPVG